MNKRARGPVTHQEKGAREKAAPPPFFFLFLVSYLF